MVETQAGLFGQAGLGSQEARAHASQVMACRDQGTWLFAACSNSTALPFRAA